MHSEVKSDKPGECPECGMALVKKKMDMKEDSNVKETEQKEHKH